MKKLPTIAFLIAIILQTTVIHGQSKKFFLPAAVNEASGLIYQNDSSFLWINDSGDGPMIYQTDLNGYLIGKMEVEGARNKDWEDLSKDKQGNIYIGDAGNNCHCRKDLKIYQWNPETKSLDSILFYYPEQQSFPAKGKRRVFDLEAFIWWKDSLHLFTKGSLFDKNFITYHYVLPARGGRYAAHLIDSLSLKNRVITAAAISQDGQKLALLSYRFKRVLGFIPQSNVTLFSFSGYDGSHFLQGSMVRQKIRTASIASQYEALDFVNEHEVWLGSEQTKVYRQQARKFSIKKATP
ncbi:MAG: hypothetical protein AAFY71_05600 [Bacteroidota bacterium]